MFNPKYQIDKLININKELWRIASYRNKYGHTPTYTLKYETSDGMNRLIELNEMSLKEIIRSGSGHDENTV